MANASRTLVLLLMLACATVPAVAQQQGADTVTGEIRVRGAGVIQMANQWFHLLGAATFERDEVCKLPSGPYQCGLIAQAKLAELSTGTQYQCTLRDFAGDPRRWATCVPYDFVTRQATAGGEDLARAWVRSGWAWAHRLHTDALVDEEDAARAARRGLWAGTMPPTSPAPQKDVVGAASVLDGNTLRVNGVLVRLAGIDAPEAPQSCSMGRGQGSYFCGIVVRAMLARMTTGKRIYCSVERREGDDRNLGTCGEADAAGTGLRAGTATLNEQMLAEGWAVVDRRTAPNAYIDLQIKADADNVGMWQGDFTTPQQWRLGFR